jgi:hypothetical protein
MRARQVMRASHDRCSEGIYEFVFTDTTWNIIRKQLTGYL